MRRLSNCLQFFLALGLFAFNLPANGQDTDSKKTIIDNSNQIFKQIESVKDLRNDCVRGQAESIIKKSIFPKSKFILQPDSLTAIETIDFYNGDKLIINNWGCEYYILTFRFETSRFQDDTSKTSNWYKNSVLLMKELYRGLDAPINIKKGIDKLINYIELNKQNDYVNLKLEQEIDFGDDEIRDFITVEKIEKVSKNKFSVTISFAKGPL